MPYPAATESDIAFFEEHGWIVVDDAIDPQTSVALERRCDEIIDQQGEMAFDWAWETDVRTRGARVQDPAVQPDARHFPEFADVAVPHLGDRVRLGA